MKKARIVALSCTHAPYTPPPTVKWICDTLGNIRNINYFVHLGDLFDAGAASVHPSEHTHTLEDEFQFGHNLLRGFRECLPRKALRICHLGNHDDNILCQDPRRIPAKLRSLVDWRKHERYGAEFKRWIWKPYIKNRDGVTSIGQIRLSHGFDAGANSDELEALQTANLYGNAANLLMVRGHTHRPLDVTQAKRTARIPLPFYFANVGTAGILKPDYMIRRDSSQWATALVVIDVIIDYRREGGRQWDARLIRMP